MNDTTTKAFDAVQMVRAIRDEISAQIAGMSAEEENRWLHATKLSDANLQRLMDRSAETRLSAMFTPYLTSPDREERPRGAAPTVPKREKAGSR